MAYFEATNLKIDNNTIKYDSNGQLMVGQAMAVDGAAIDDNHASLSTTYSSTKINSLISGGYVLPMASTDELGGVKIDDETIEIDNNGYIKVKGGLKLDISSPQEGDVLTYSSILQKWTNGTVEGGSGGSSRYNDIYARTSLNLGRSEEGAVGTNSATIGDNNIVSANYSMAVGAENKIESNINYSFVSGYDNEIIQSSNSYSTTSTIFGRFNTIKSTLENFIIGEFNTIEDTGYSNFICGIDNRIFGSSYFQSCGIIGIGSHIVKDSSYETLESSSGGALCVGYHNNIINNRNWILGYECDAYGLNNFITGRYNEAKTNVKHCILGGIENELKEASCSLIMGVGNYYGGQQSIITGSINKSRSFASITFGNSDESSANNSLIGGYSNHIYSHDSLVVGSDNYDYNNNYYAFIIGDSNVIGAVNGKNYLNNADFSTFTNDYGSHHNNVALGTDNIVYGYYNYAEGYKCSAGPSNCHAEGYNSIAMGSNCHAEIGSISLGNACHAEGTSIVMGSLSHAEGYRSITRGVATHSSGFLTKAIGNYSTVVGRNNIASANQFVLGKYNIPNNSSCFIIGNGNEAFIEDYSIITSFITSEIYLPGTGASQTVSFKLYKNGNEINNINTTIDFLGSLKNKEIAYYCFLTYDKEIEEYKLFSNNSLLNTATSLHSLDNSGLLDTWKEYDITPIDNYYVSYLEWKDNGGTLLCLFYGDPFNASSGITRNCCYYITNQITDSIEFNILGKCAYTVPEKCNFIFQNNLIIHDALWLYYHDDYINNLEIIQLNEDTSVINIDSIKTNETEYGHSKGIYYNSEYIRFYKYSYMSMQTSSYYNNYINGYNRNILKSGTKLFLVEIKSSSPYYSEKVLILPTDYVEIYDLMCHRSNAHTLDWNGNAWYAGEIEDGHGNTLSSLSTQINTGLTEVENELTDLSDTVEELSHQKVKLIYASSDDIAALFNTTNEEYIMDGEHYSV